MAEKIPQHHLAVIAAAAAAAVAMQSKEEPPKHTQIRIRMPIVIRPRKLRVPELPKPVKKENA